MTPAGNRTRTPRGKKRTIDAWRSIVVQMRAAVAGRNARQLDARRPAAAMSIRETVHHLVEANVVAATIVTAALGAPGCTFDWSWMLPFGKWMDRMSYDEKPLGPALELLAALNAWVVAQVEPLADGLARTVQLRDAPGAKLRTATVAEVMLTEVEHARAHLAEASRERSIRRPGLTRRPRAAKNSSGQ